MADGPRCKRRKQANPRRKNGKNRPEPNFSGPLRGSRPREQGGGRGKRNRGGGGAQGSRASLPPRPAPEPCARRLAGGVGEVPGKVSGGRRRAPARGCVRGPAPHPRRPSRPRLRPPSTSASRSASSRPAGSPAGLRSVRLGQGGGPGAGFCRIQGRGRGWLRDGEGKRGGPGLCLCQAQSFFPESPSCLSYAK